MINLMITACIIQIVGRKGGGVAIYVKNTFRHRLLNEMTYVVYDLPECSSIELTYLNNIKYNNLLI